MPFVDFRLCAHGPLEPDRPDRPDPQNRKVLISMRRKGVPADEVTMNSIIDGLVSCSPPRVREAETVLALMAGWGLKPNQVTFGYLQVPRPVCNRRCRRQAVSISLAVRNVLAVSENRRRRSLWRSPTHSLCKRRQDLQRSESDLMHLAACEGHSMRTLTFPGRFSVLCLQGASDDRPPIPTSPVLSSSRPTLSLSCLLSTGFPSQVSFTVMLKGYGRIGDLGAAELMFEVIAADSDQQPDVVALNSILDACVRNGDLRRAVEILEQVRFFSRLRLMCVCCVLRTLRRRRRHRGENRGVIFWMGLPRPFLQKEFSFSCGGDRSLEQQFSVHFVSEGRVLDAYLRRRRRGGMCLADT